ncbi:hypothetical protein [Dyella koreensis]|uniref:Uncharacterized protein n=1 Tax=Dyella koreensis TaxID=311235 RepID=A0ABW8K2N1_9GAMM
MTDGQTSAPFVVNIDTHVSPPPTTLSINGADTPNGIVSDNGHVDYQGELYLFGDAPPNTGVSIWDGDTWLGGFIVNSMGHWDFHIPRGIGTNDGEHHYTARNNATGESTEPFDLSISHTSTGHDQPNSLSLNDVLGSGEGELFAVDHSHDNTQLSVHDVEAVAVDGHVANGVNVAAHDGVSLNANLVLPHEQMHAHAVM